MSVHSVTSSPTIDAVLSWIIHSGRQHPNVLHGGAGGGGKSHGLRLNAVRWHLYLRQLGVRNIRTVLAAATYGDLQDRFFGKFAEEYGHLGKIAKRNTGDDGLAFYFHDKSLGAIRLRNLDDPDKYRGTEVMAAFVDEASVLPATYAGLNVLSLLRYPLRSSQSVPCFPLVLASNWDGIGFEWIVKAFYERTDFQGLPPEDFAFVPALLDDNPNEAFKEAFRPQLEALTGHLRDSRLLGIPTRPIGAMFPNLSEALQGFTLRYKFPRGIPPHWPRFLTIDWGVLDPFAAHWHTQHPDGREIYTYREVYQPGLTTAQQVHAVRDLTGIDEQISAVYMDPAMWASRRDHSTLMELPSIATDFLRGFGADQRFGPVLPGWKDQRVLGWSVLRSMLDRSGYQTAWPEWWIDKQSCPALWSELANAIYHKGPHGQFTEDLQEGRADHGMTGCVYGFRARFGRTSDQPDPNAPRVAPPELELTPGGGFVTSDAHRFRRTDYRRPRR